MAAHARLAPSSAGRWVLCPGSVQMEEKFPERAESEAAREGTAIHEVAAKVIEDFLACGRKGHTFKRSDFLDTTASNGVVITDEMLDVAEVYVRDVLQVSGRFGGMAKVVLEHRVTMPAIHPENWGTLDAAILFHDFDSGELVVADLKAGWSIVEVWDNWQLLNYTAGLLHDMHERGHPMPKVIELRLVQPRPYHRDGPVRVWRFPTAELGPYVERLSAAAYEALSDSPRLIAGGSQCDNCKARSACPALLQTGYRIGEVISGVNPAELKGESLGKHLTALAEAEKLVSSLREALEEKALVDCQQGRPVLGWMPVRKESRVKWDVPAEEVTFLGDSMGIDLRKNDVITPKQAISAGVPEWLVSSVSSSKPAGFKLVPVNLKAIGNVFKQE